VKRLMARYTVKPERAAENVELVRAVYDELHGAQPVLAQPTGDGYWPLVTIAETTSPSASRTKRRQSCEK
jgi:hypothetical protein